MKSLFLVLCFSLSGTIALAQYNPEKPDLRQGRFFTEEQAAKVHEDLAKKYTDKKSWEKRAALIRQGILDGSELNQLTLRQPTNITIHSKKVFMDYSVENVSFQSLDGIYVTGNLYRPLEQGKKNGRHSLSAWTRTRPPPKRIYPTTLCHTGSNGCSSFCL